MKGFMTMIPNEENIIGFDFQGWPVRKMNIREIITNLFGAVLNEETGKYEIDKHLTEVIPTVYTDDGMGYCVNESYIVDAEYCDGDYRLLIDARDEYIDIYIKDRVQPGMTIVTPDGSKKYVVDAYVPVCCKYRVREFKKDTNDFSEPKFIDREIIAEWARQENEKWREIGE